MVKLIGVIGIVLMAVEYAKPIQWLKIYYKVDHGSDNKKDLKRQIIQGLVNCCLCLGFWIGLTFYLDLYMAVIVSFASEIAYRLYNKLTTFI